MSQGERISLWRAAWFRVHYDEGMTWRRRMLEDDETKHDVGQWAPAHVFFDGEPACRYAAASEVPFDDPLAGDELGPKGVPLGRVCTWCHRFWKIARGWPKVEIRGQAPKALRTRGGFLVSRRG